MPASYHERLYKPARTNEREILRDGPPNLFKPTPSLSATTPPAYGIEYYTAETAQVVKNQEVVRKRDLNEVLRPLGMANKPTSEFDNFYTPENKPFYSKSLYKPLDASRSEIRLLRVFNRKTTHDSLFQFHPHWDSYGKLNPGYRDEKLMIGCDLLQNVPLARVHGKYLALSYCAGSPEDVQPILVDGVQFNAFANLEHALSAAIDFWQAEHPGQELLIWADQVCINQSDVDERAAQVGIMRDIYKRGRETLICLSIHPLSVERARQPLHVSSSSMTSFRTRVPLPTAQIQGKGSNKSAPLPAEPAASVIGLNEKLLWERLPNEESLKLAVLTLRQLFGCRWWTRAWVFQEFMVSSRTYFIYNSEYLPWTNLRALVTLMHNDMDDILVKWELKVAEMTKRKDDEQRREEKKQEAEIKAKVKAFENERMLVHQKSKAKKLKQNEEYAERFADADAMLKKNMEVWEKAHKEWSEKMDKVTKERTEQRRLELQSKLDSYVVKALRSRWRSYSSEKTKLTNQLATIVSDIEREKKDRPDLYPEEPKRPTRGYVGLQVNMEHWEADHLSDMHALINREEQRLRGEAEQRASLLKITSNFRRPRYGEKLWDDQSGIEFLRSKLPGIRNNAVLTLTTAKANRRQFPDLKEVLRHSKASMSSDPRDRVYAFVGLANKDYGIVPDYGYANTILHVLIHTAMRIVATEKGLAILRYVNPASRGRLGPLLPTWVPDWTSGDDGLMEAWELAVAQARARQGSDREGREFRAGGGDPEPGTGGAPPRFRRDKSDDSIVDLLVHGRRIRRLDDPDEVESEAAMLHTFVSPIGNSGAAWHITTPKTAQAGDEVWVLRGAAMPVVLRGEGGSGYSYLGEAMVCDAEGRFAAVMFGEERVPEGEVWEEMEVAIV